MFASALRYAACRASVRAAYHMYTLAAVSTGAASGFHDSPYLLLVVQALVVVLKHRHAFRLAAVVFGVCVGHVACENFLPEGEAARGAWEAMSVVFCTRGVWCAMGSGYGSVESNGHGAIGVVGRGTPVGISYARYQCNPIAICVYRSVNLACGVRVPSA